MAPSLPGRARAPPAGNVVAGRRINPDEATRAPMATVGSVPVARPAGTQESAYPVAYAAAVATSVPVDSVAVARPVHAPNLPEVDSEEMLLAEARVRRSALCLFFFATFCTNSVQGLVGSLGSLFLLCGGGARGVLLLRGCATFTAFLSMLTLVVELSGAGPVGRAAASCGSGGYGPADLSVYGTLRGTLRVYHNGTWGTVCDDGWSRANSEVACRQLGLVPAHVAPAYHAHSTPFSALLTSGVVHMDNVRCTGNERTLAECPFNGWNVHDCRGHYEDVALRCIAPIAKPLRPCAATANCTDGRQLSTAAAPSQGAAAVAPAAAGGGGGRLAALVAAVRRRGLQAAGVTARPKTWADGTLCLGDDCGQEPAPGAFDTSSHCTRFLIAAIIPAVTNALLMISALSASKHAGQLKLLLVRRAMLML